MKKIFFICLIGIIYGSLLPFQFKALNLSDSFQIFFNIPYLDLDVASRSDWIANGLLYLPLGFFLAACFIREGPFFTNVTWAIFCTIGCIGIAVFIEYLQVFITIRTVSLNDLYAESIGSSIGVILWLYFGKNLERMLISLKSGGDLAIKSVLISYSLVFLIFSFYPFDFLLSASEISWKISNAKYSLLFVNNVFNLHRLPYLFLDVVSVVPFGFLLARTFVCSKTKFLWAMLFSGVILGLVVEGVQFFIASGVSQGGSVLSKMLGVVVGGYLQRYLPRRWIDRMRPYIPVAVLSSIFPYLLVVLSLQGWFSYRWNTFDMAIASFDWPTIIPFYYHYFSTESVAVVGLLSNALLYGVIGIGGCLLFKFSDKYHPARILTSISAAFLALFIEAGKLFLNGKFSDITNVFIAYGSTWLFYSLVDICIGWPWLQYANESEIIS